MLSDFKFINKGYQMKKNSPVQNYISFSNYQGGKKLLF